eukprot:UN05361
MYNGSELTIQQQNVFSMFNCTVCGSLVLTQLYLQRNRPIPNDEFYSALFAFPFGMTMPIYLTNPNAFEWDYLHYGLVGLFFWVLLYQNLVKCNVCGSNRNQRIRGNYIPT